MELLNNIPQHAIWLLAFMIGFGVFWKKSKWPNQYFPVVNLLLPIVLYPLLEISISDEPYHQYRQPVVVLCLAGAAVAVATAVLHNAIVAFLKKRFPGLEFPDETETNTNTNKNEKQNNDGTGGGGNGDH